MTRAAILWIHALWAPLFVSCTSTAESTITAFPFSFIHPRPHSESTLVKVAPGADRSSVEAGLVQDQVGSERLVQWYEDHFTFKRIRSTETLERVLNEFFGGGDDVVRDLWKRYPNATFCGLECDNYTIIFFDREDRAVTAYPDK